MKVSVYGVLCFSFLIVDSESKLNPENETVRSKNTVDGYSIPLNFLSPVDEYPNPLNITEADRQNFHPVVKFPKIWIEQNDDDSDKKRGRKVDNYQILDLQTSSATNELASEAERIKRREEVSKRKWGRRNKDENDPLKGYGVGRYDENRVNLYASEMFDDSTHTIDGYAGERTVHIGIDLDGPVGTQVFAFTKGVVHSSGYNSDRGDYGNVVVIEHDLGEVNGMQRKIWALYGHLNDQSVLNMPPGKPIKRGQHIGRFGDIHENGGWRIPHVHFQLSLEPPETHDMPGAVSVIDRPRALVQYPDPRWVLGKLY